MGSNQYLRFEKKKKISQKKIRKFTCTSGSTLVFTFRDLRRQPTWGNWCSTSTANRCRSCLTVGPDATSDFKQNPISSYPIFKFVLLLAIASLRSYAVREASALLVYQCVFALLSLTFYIIISLKLTVDNGLGNAIKSKEQQAIFLVNNVMMDQTITLVYFYLRVLVNNVAHLTTSTYIV